MVRKLSNEENIRNLKKRKIMRYAMIVLLIATLTLTICHFIFGISIIWGLAAYVASYCIKIVWERTPINRVDDLSSVRKEIVKVNKRKK